MNRRRIELRYRLGDLSLFRVGFDAFVQIQPFDPAKAPITLPIAFPKIPNGSSLIVRAGISLPHLMQPLQASSLGIRYVRNQETNYYIDLSVSFDEYLKTFSSKARSTIQRKARKVSTTMEFRSFRTSSEALEFHKLAREVAVKTYQERLFRGAIPESASFVASLEELAKNDCFRGYVLLAEGRPVSYLFFPVKGGVLTYEYLGYDPEYENLSVGTVLLFWAIERLFQERQFRYIDFTPGENQNKKLFGRKSLLRCDIYFFRWSMRNVIAVYAHRATDLISGSVGRLLDLFELHQAARRLLRRS